MYERNCQLRTVRTFCIEVPRHRSQRNPDFVQTPFLGVFLTQHFVFLSRRREKICVRLPVQNRSHHQQYPDLNQVINITITSATQTMIRQLIVLLFILSHPVLAQEELVKTFKSKMAIPAIGTEGGQIVRVAQSFINTPYVANTLEGNPKEELVCKFDGLDCVTLVDNVLALAISKKNNFNFEQFRKLLTQIRYRNALIEGYGSRLHYFVDWVYEGEKNEIVRDVTRELGGIEFGKTINFITSHPDLYPSANTSDIWNQLSEAEQQINQRPKYYIPAHRISGIEALLNEGDIVGITSTIDGLDCNHQGIITKIGSRAYLIHASSVQKKVVLSAKPLAEYVASVKKNSGIIVARPTLVNFK